MFCIVFIGDDVIMNCENFGNIVEIVIYYSLGDVIGYINFERYFVEFVSFEGRVEGVKIGRFFI